MIHYDSNDRVFHLTNGIISYILQVEDFGLLAHVYYGRAVKHYSGIKRYPRISRNFEVNLEEAQSLGQTYSVGTLLQEFPVYGKGDFREPAMIIRHEDGSRVSDFRYADYRIIKGKPSMDDLPHARVQSADEAMTLEIQLVDAEKSLTLYLYYTIFQDSQAIVRSTRIVNTGTQTSTLERIASLNIDLPARPLELIQLHGSWARERQLSRERVHHGTKRLDSKRGTSSHQQTPFIALVSPDTNEHHGEVIAAQLIYSGSYEMIVEQDSYEQVRLLLGIQSTGFAWQLEPGESLQTPEAVLTYSDQGLNGMSQSFHHFIKKYLIPRRYETLDRPVLVNNWEGTYFAFTESKIKAMIDQASDLGIELFVLDDGWFGTRDDDTSSLGDWFVHQEKLPHGLKGLSDYAHERGLQFGLWFEPEMISQESHLFRAHPDFAIQAPGRSLSRSRNQYVLDFSRKDVVDHIFEQMVRILDAVQIDYIKWDMNRHLSEVHSLALPPERQGEVAHRYVLGVYDLMERLTKRYPQILFESCSGGGGRFDLGMLYYMPQVWTSDNTDAVCRLSIQYGTSMIAPLNTMGAHVSAVPNHQTGRVTSLDFRGDVAMFGVFGYELDITTLEEDVLTAIRHQIDTYKSYRHLYQQGTFTRLLSPFEGNTTAWMVSSEDAREHIVAYYEIMSIPSKPLQTLKIPNLDPECRYQVTTQEASFTAYGDELMHIGLYVNPTIYGDFQARLYHLKAVER